MTMARAIKLLGEVANPTPAKNVGEVDATSNNWETKMAQLAKQFSEELVKNDMKFCHYDLSTASGDPGLRAPTCQQQDQVC